MCVCVFVGVWVCVSVCVFVQVCVCVCLCVGVCVFVRLCEYRQTDRQPVDGNTRRQINGVCLISHFADLSSEISRLRVTYITHRMTTNSQRG